MIPRAEIYPQRGEIRWNQAQDPKSRQAAGRLRIVPSQDGPKRGRFSGRRGVGMNYRSTHPPRKAEA